MKSRSLLDWEKNVKNFCWLGSFAKRLQNMAVIRYTITVHKCHCWNRFSTSLHNYSHSILNAQVSMYKNTISLTISATDATWSRSCLTPPLRFSPQPGNTVQLSASGYQFLTDLFRKYDKDGDNALSTAEQEVSHLCPLTFHTHIML